MVVSTSSWYGARESAYSCRQKGVSRDVGKGRRKRKTHANLAQPQFLHQRLPPLLPAHLLLLRALTLLPIHHHLIILIVRNNPILQHRHESREEQDGLIDPHDVLEVGNALLEALRDAVEVGHGFEEVVLRARGKRRG